MSVPTFILQTSTFQGVGFFLGARNLGLLGVNITQSTIASITMKIFDLDAGNEEVHSANLVVADTVFDTLQTSDPRWWADTKGYDFGVVVPGSALMRPGHLYRVEVVFTPVVGGIFALAVHVSVLELLSVAP